MDVLISASNFIYCTHLPRKLLHLSARVVRNLVKTFEIEFIHSISVFSSQFKINYFFYVRQTLLFFFFFLIFILTTVAIVLLGYVYLHSRIRKFNGKKYLEKFEKNQIN